VRGALGVGAMRGRGAGTRASQRSTAVRRRNAARAVGGMLMASVDDSKSAMSRTKPRSRARATRDAARTTAPIDHKPGIVLSLAGLGATPGQRRHLVLQRATTELRTPSSACCCRQPAGGTPRGAFRARLLGCRRRWRQASRAPTASRGRGDLCHGTARGAHEYREHFMAGALRVRQRGEARLEAHPTPA
jgi:hypothetical protein